MSLLTVDQIQYNGGTALTLPTATPAAGDLLQTNGSATLSWRDRLQKVTNAAGTVTYTTPSNIVSGKALGTDGGNTMGWFSAGGDPMAIGSHVGWRLADKADFCSTISAYGGSLAEGANANISSIDLKIPSTVNASDVISYSVRGIGIGFSQGNVYIRAKPINAIGNSIVNGSKIGHLLQIQATQNGTQYSTPNNDYITITDSSPSYFDQTNAQVDTSYGDFNGYVSGITLRRQSFFMQHYNAKYDFDGTVDSYLQYDNNDDDRYTRSSLVYQGPGNIGSFQMSTDYAAGFQFYVNAGEFLNGTIELYYCLRDGV